MSLDTYPDFGTWNTKIQVGNGFDFRIYLALNLDLDNVIEFDARKAYIHWATQGAKEKRLYTGVDPNNWDHWETQRKHPSLRTIKDLWFAHVRGQSQSPSLDKYYLFELAPYKNSGLVNQLYGILNGLVLCWMAKRKMVVTGYYPQYSVDQNHHLGELLDLVKMNAFLSKYQLTLGDYRDLPGANWVPSKCPNVLCSPYAVNQSQGYLDRLCLDMSLDTAQYVRQGSALHVNVKILQEPPRQDFCNLFLDLAGNIVFAPKILQEAQNVKRTLKLGNNYLCVHLRLEDDMLKALYYDQPQRFPNRQLAQRQIQTVIDRYKTKIRELVKRSQIPIYVCTSLATSKNEYSHIISELQQEFPKLTWKRQGLNQGREIDAAVDLTIAQEASGAVVFGFSSFSWILDLIFRSKNKPVVTVEHY